MMILYLFFLILQRLQLFARNAKIVYFNVLMKQMLTAHQNQMSSVE